MTELITKIEPIKEKGEYWGNDAGFKITTDDQEIKLLIDDDANCCESWGYFLTEDDTEQFVGANLLGVEITDTNRSNRVFLSGWNDEADPDDDREREYLDEGDVLFVDIITSRGTLQFVAYNAHNGYYGHSARVESKQLNATRSL